MKLFSYKGKYCSPKSKTNSKPETLRKSAALRQPVAAQKPAAPASQKPEAPRQPMGSKKPAAPKHPVAAQKPAVPSSQKPEAPRQPMESKKPAAPKQPVAAQKPAASASQKPEAPRQPMESKKPAASKQPMAHQKPATPKQPVASQKSEASRQSIAKRKTMGKKMSPLAAVMLILLATVLLVGIFLGGRSLWAAYSFRRLSNHVQEQVAIAATETTWIDSGRDNALLETTDAVSTDPVSTDQAATETQPVETEPVVRTILPHYAELYSENTELYGWIRIDDTVIDYPVMRSFDDPEKYLHANFYGNYSYPGIPFADSKCSNESDNLLIYGHNMLDGSMFRSLLKYENKSYWEAHPTIMFSDLYEDYEYEIVAAFYDRIYLKSDTCFKFYQFIDAENEADFDYAISQFKEKALYDTGVEAQYGDHLITLITCAYHVENGRFVVVARRK